MAALRLPSEVFASFAVTWSLDLLTLQVSGYEDSSLFKADKNNVRVGAVLMVPWLYDGVVAFEPRRAARLRNGPHSLEAMRGLLQPNRHPIEA